MFVKYEIANSISDKNGLWAKCLAATLGSEDVYHTVLPNFYVDDLLKYVEHENGLLRLANKVTMDRQSIDPGLYFLMKTKKNITIKSTKNSLIRTYFLIHE